MSAIDPDFKAKAPRYRTAVVRTHVFTENGTNDLQQGEIVGVRYRFEARNQLFRRDESVFTVTRQGGAIWGDVYASVLTDFVL